MDNYAIYLRKSRADIELESIEKMETLARHKKILLELANRKQLKVTDIYEEIVSGESIDDRPQMQALLKAVFAKKYKGVLVVEIERLARGNTKEQGEVAEAFKFSNTLIITPTKTYDPNNQFDEEYFEFGLFMSRREYKTIRRRLQQGIIESVKDGNYVGSLPPYGYDIVRLDKKTRTLKLNDQSPYVENMFNWFVNDGLSSGQIAKKLTEMGIPTLTGKPFWNRSTVIDILQNNLYTGKIRWNRRKVSKEYDGKSLKRTKKRQLSDDYLIADGKHPAIISEELFNKAQSMFKHQARNNYNMPLVNPLAGILVCKHCGRVLSMNRYCYKETTKPRYVHRDPNYCKLKSVYCDDVLNAVIDTLKQIIDDYEIKIENNKDIKPNNNLIDVLESELKACLTRKDEIYEYFEKKIYSLDEFLTRKEKNESRINALRQSIEDEKANNVTINDYKTMVTTYQKIIDTLKDDSIPAEYKNDFLKEVIDKIEYSSEDLGRQHGSNITLEFYFK